MIILGISQQYHPHIPRIRLLPSRSVIGLAGDLGKTS